MLEASTSAKRLVESEKGAVVSEEKLTKTLNQSSISAKAANLAIKGLAIAGNMLASWAISEGIKLLYDCATASDRLKKSASELSETFASDKADIEGYKDRIEELYKTINSSSSSYEDTYNARKELLSIQDELIAKFGDEAESIQLVTEAVNGNTQAFEKLTAKQWAEAVNEFNFDPDRTWTQKVSDSIANFFSGSNTNFERMIKEVENSVVQLHITPSLDDENYQKFINSLHEDYGAIIVNTEYDDVITLNGNLDDLHDKLIDIQNLATDMNISDKSFIRDLGEQAEKTKESWASYEDFYNQHVLNDKIFNDAAYTESFKKIQNAYKDYQDSYATGNNEAIEKAKQTFASVVHEATGSLTDDSVVDYFRNMYPDLKAVVGEWEFKLKFTPDVADENDIYEGQVISSLSKFKTSDDILGYNSAAATDEQRSAYKFLEQEAKQHSMTVAGLVDMYVRLGLIQSQVKSDLTEKLIPAEGELTTDVKNWISEISEEEAKLANSKEFERALESRKRAATFDEEISDVELYRLALQDVIDAQNQLGSESSVSFSDLFSSLPIDKLEEFISLVNSGTIDEKTISQYPELADAMEQTEISAEEAVAKIKEIAEETKLSADLTKSIQDSYDALESIKEEFATTKQISLDSLQTIATQFPELTYATSQYAQGLITAEDLMQQLEQAYYNDEEAYRYNMTLKMEDDAEFWQSVAENNQEFFTALGEAYQIDTANWKSLAEAKAAIDEQLIHSLSGAWGQYFDTIIDANTGMVSVVAKMAPEDESAEYLSAYAEINKIVEAKNKLTEAAKIEVKTPDFGGIGKKNTSGSGSGSGSDSEKQAKQQEIDWIARKNEILQKQHDAIMEVANDETESYNERIAALKELIEKDKERASIAEQSAAKYQEAWGEAKAGLRDSDIAKIMNGALEIDTYDSLELEKLGIADGEAYIELLQKAMELWDLKEEAQKNQNDIQKETDEHLVEEVRLREEIIKAQQESLSAQMDILESRIDLADATGKYVGAGTYKDMIAVSKEMSSVYEDQIDNLYEQLSLFDEESAEWYSIKGQIADCEQAISQCTIQQAEWNETIKRLPIDRLQTYIDLLENIKQDLQNFTDENSVLGLNPTKEQYQQFIDINQEELDSLIKQQEKLKDILGDYEYGSEKYNDVSGEIQDIDDRISSLIQSQLEYNDAILQIPITEMENYYNNLSAAKTALENAIAEDNAKGLSTTIDQYNILHNITLQQLQALYARRDALTSLLSVYDKESDKYRETQDAINSINSEMSSLVQNQYQWNQEILNIPIDKLNEINDNLNSYASILDGVISDYESAITGVNSLLDDEIDKINELRDATEKEYEAKIKPLEDELNLLEKTNEARSVQIGLEQAQYNLEKVQNQKTTQVKLIA